MKNAAIAKQNSECVLNILWAIVISCKKENISPKKTDEKCDLLSADLDSAKQPH